MKNGFRQSMAWLHTWTGLVVGWVLFFVFVTGNLGRFDTEIDQWMMPEAIPQQVSLQQQINLAQQRLEQRAADAERWIIYPTTNRDTAYLRIRSDARPQGEQVNGKRTEEYLDASSGEPLDARATGGGQLLYKMHYALHYMPRSVSDWIIGICSMFMLVAIISGVITHKKIFADFFTFRPNKGQRSWLDLHAVLAVVTLPFFLMITYSGLVFFVFTLFPGIIGANFGSGEKNRQIFNDELIAREFRSERANTQASLASLSAMAAVAERRWGEGQVRTIEVSHPGDTNAQVRITRQITSPLRSTEEIIFVGSSGDLLGDQAATSVASRTFYETLLGLHESLFAGWWLRWLYFLSGLIGAAIIGSGLILWIVKRRPKQLKQADGPDFGHRLVEGLNVGTIVGLHIAIAAYFFANRLLPVELSARNEWEVHVFFIVWLAALLHPVVRPINRAWVEQLWVATAAFVFLPVVNALTTERGFIQSLVAGDWVFVGFDLVSLTAAGLFATAAIKLSRREKLLSIDQAGAAGAVSEKRKAERIQPQEAGA